MADEITAPGKYLYIEVPNFATETLGPRKQKDKDAPPQPMSSFVHLGAFQQRPQIGPNDSQEVQERKRLILRSWALAEHAKMASMAQGGHINDDYGAEIIGFESERGVPFFLDDERRREGAPGEPDADKQKQSDALFTRGGWWDHSDGNRISTTWGDKVEVIRGNYKMVVMGRQDDPGSSAGWDVSGGHVQDNGQSMPGASVRVEYRQDKHTGSWHLENTTNNFIQTSDYAGDFFEHWYGDKKYSTIGSENPVDHDGDKPLGNPHILEKTWSRKIESYTGSSGWRVPEIIEETWAKTTTSKTDVSGDIHESTTCGGDQTSKTKVTGTIREETTCDVQHGFTLAGAITDVTIAGAQEEVAILGHHGSVEVCALLNEIFLGFKLNLTAGASLELVLGKHEEIVFPEKKDMALKRLKTQLKELECTLEREVAALSDRSVTLETAIESIMVRLGG